jgi:hypothetical protein
MLQPRLQNPEKPYDPYRINCRIIPSYWDFEPHHQQSEAFLAGSHASSLAAVELLDKEL